MKKLSLMAAGLMLSAGANAIDSAVSVAVAGSTKDFPENECAVSAGSSLTLTFTEFFAGKDATSDIQTVSITNCGTEARSTVELAVGENGSGFAETGNADTASVSVGDDGDTATVTLSGLVGVTDADNNAVNETVDGQEVQATANAFDGAVEFTESTDVLVSAFIPSSESAGKIGTISGSADVTVRIGGFAESRPANERPNPPSNNTSEGNDPTQGTLGTQQS